MEAFNLLPDPQTNGGLLIAVRESDAEAVKDLFRQNGLGDFVEPIGQLAPATEKTILVKV